ncbi:response regulator transcription factor [Anatilimnocola sp. NA78]|uniref:response regulator transcription factor n=1 Tax=Anatilimnocola sp. NA78 TaxID=3415683 RepID=UPI003CE51E0A
MSAKHILVVEDERHLAVGIKFNLEAEGFQVTTVGDGPSALRLIDEGENDFDLIILDLMLPSMSGYAVCETIRNNGNDVPILILSARTLTEDRTRGFNVGASQYLTKPFDLDELLSRVKNLLTHFPRRRYTERVMPTKITSFEFGEAKIDFPRFHLQIDGKEVQLTKREWELLQYFVEHEGRLIPRQELLQNVWQMPGHIQTRAVDQFILRLRKIFEHDHASPKYFLTVRDMGYRFVKQPDAEIVESTAGHTPEA